LINGDGDPIFRVILAIRDDHPDLKRKWKSDSEQLAFAVQEERCFMIFSRPYTLFEVICSTMAARP
jgi:hypothetical protein